MCERPNCIEKKKAMFLKISMHVWARPYSRALVRKDAGTKSTAATTYAGIKRVRAGHTLLCVFMLFII